MPRSAIVIAAVLALAVTLPAVSAQAQSPRTFVSAAGSDSNPCSFAAPCRHFQAAVAVTNFGGEVDALDPAGYGPINITQPITIEGQGWSYIAPPAGENGITINALGGVVTIRGVSLNGIGITGTTNGIKLIASASLTVRDCVIQNFTNDGIEISIGDSTGVETFFISNTIVQDNGSSGIELTGPLALRGVIDHVAANQNGMFGITVDATHEISGNFMDVAITDSIADSNVGSGINVQGNGNVKVDIKATTSSNNGANGVSVSNARVGLSKNMFVLNAAGFSITGSQMVTTFGDNLIENNRSASTGTLTPATLQ
jgi:hypothetical protein